MEIQWPLAIFSLLAGCGGGLLAATGAAEWLSKSDKDGKVRFASLVAALGLLIIGGCASVLHLQHPANIMAAAVNLFSFSGISIELAMLGLNCIVAFIYLLAPKRGFEPSALKALGVVAMVVGALMAFAVGNGYVMEGRASWNTPILPLSYLASGLTCGVTLYLAISSLVSREAGSLQGLSVAAIVLGAAQLAAFCAFGVQAGFGHELLVFIGGAVVVGSLGTLAFSVASRKFAICWWGAFACALVGGLCFRAFMWLIGDGFFTAFSLAAGRAVLGI